eukprot:TRINITY_DN17251_c0_g2_i6.p1 TRINITY_DN17251_c0_g2~~TRINITY_DN17251_c0_g2_i6.p1  ORF type:complete len:696 (-),score=126.85 TRINITY_DN17251_c0_g2_i6:405-2492(-)
MRIGSGIVDDFKARIPWYKHDWTEGLNSGVRIFAPATYIFFASVIPALAFGEQLSEDTERTLNGVHVLVATGLCGIIQALFGGQPLLIVGVAEPIVLVYMFMFEFAKEKKIEFLPWATWVCIWTSSFIFVLAGLNSCKFIDKFTRFSGEVFGMLIAVLFLQQAVKGTVEQYKPVDYHEVELGHHSDEANTVPWRLANGLWGTILALGLLYTSLQLHEARSWRFFKGFIRSFIADYGVPLMVVVWTGISYIIDGWPHGLPKRLQIPNTWDVTGTWKVVEDLSKVDAEYITAAMIPAFIITLLFYFDHNVSSQLAQQKEFNLVKPGSYNWDFMLLGVMTLICGLIGVPPVNGVLPQAPMHTKSLATLKKMLRKVEMRKSNSAMKLNDKNSLKKETSKASLQSLEERNTLDMSAEKHVKLPTEEQINTQVEATGKQAGYQAESGSSSTINEASESAKIDPTVQFEPITHFDVSELRKASEVLPIEVKEQRLSGLIQSLLVTACLGLTPVIKWIPQSVLWGYFAYMALESLPGSQFWDRLLLIITDRKKRFKLLETTHAPYLETVPFRVIVWFTLFQLAYMCMVWGVTWAGIAGILFPIPIMLLIPIRMYLMPKMFKKEHLAELDAADYEEAPAIPHSEVVQAAGAQGVKFDDETEEKEVLYEEFASEIGYVKHHLTREQVTERKRRSFEPVPQEENIV